MLIIAEQMQIFKGEDFSGRQTIVDSINQEFESIKVGKGRSVVNLYGIGGIGKTSIMQFIRFSNYGTPSAIVDFRANSLDIFDIVGLLHDFLLKSSENASVAFSKYEDVKKALERVKNKLFKRVGSKDSKLFDTLFIGPAKEVASSISDETSKAMDVLASSKESTENDGTSTGTTGVLSAIGGAINGVVGKGIGALATAGLGLTISKVIERQRQDSITALNQIGLNRKDIEVFISYKKNLVSAFIEGVNKLADEDASLILGFDTFEKVPAHVSQWLRRDIIPNLNSRILVFICGRERIKFETTQ